MIMSVIVAWFISFVWCVSLALKNEILLVAQSRMDDRLDDAIHVLRNHAEPAALSGHSSDASLRLPPQSTTHSTARQLGSANGLTFAASLPATAGQAVHPTPVSYSNLYAVL